MSLSTDISFCDRVQSETPEQHRSHLSISPDLQSCGESSSKYFHGTSLRHFVDRRKRSSPSRSHSIPASALTVAHSLLRTRFSPA
ncbi:hypothetical protein E4U56_005988, partial [Claviceps arundinis]